MKGVVSNSPGLIYTAKVVLSVLGLRENLIR